MRRVCVGIPIRERTDWLDATLQSVRLHTERVSTVVLADGLDNATRRSLDSALCDELIAWEHRLGDPHCFNRLVSERDADLFILLENGAKVTPHWLERMLHALDADAAHALAGPSTNRAWNEQRLAVSGVGSAEELACIARDTAARFGDTYATLEPLYSLGAFCYLVTRRVVDRIGAADEGYGNGPCWELEYNARAARVGLRGAWAKAAFVWRAPPTASQSALEARWFPASKRRYQDQLCAQRLRGSTSAYEAHCAGDACEHFAPRELMLTRREFASRRLTSAPTRGPSVVPPASTELPPAKAPWVSCIMPTANRRPYVQLAIAAFLAQDYEPRELIVIDDGADAVGDLIPADDRIRYVRSSLRQSLGSKRNQACQLARGEIIVHWDDDDWHAKWRLSYQVGSLLAHDADICGLARVWFYDAQRDQAWQYRYMGSAAWLAGGTFCYRKSVWARRRFADLSSGEDTRFVRELTGRKVLALERDDFFVARIHGANTSRHHTTSASWQRVNGTKVRALVESVLSVLGDTPGVELGRTNRPLVSCIMPTRDRRPFVELSIALFARQHYARRELIMIDDGAESVRDLAERTSGVRYVQVAHGTSVGEKRNIGCDVAQGDIIMHWDDDDWYGAARITRQVEALLHGDGDVVALAMRYLLELSAFRFWKCLPRAHARLHYRDLCPGTIAYWRNAWTQGPRYPRINVAEDVGFLRALPSRTRLVRLPEEHHFVCVRHGANTWQLSQSWSRDPLGWAAIDVPDFLPEPERLHLRSLSQAIQTPEARR